MVLSRIILTALLALGSIAVALPVVPGGGVTSTMPTPGSGARLPRMQDLEASMKGLSISPLAGGPSSPPGNEAGSNISRRQPSSAAGSSSNVPLPEINANSLFTDPSEAQKEELRRQINLIKNFPDVHQTYKAIANRLYDNLHIPPIGNPRLEDFISVAQDSTSVSTIALAIELYMPPHKGKKGDSRQKLWKIHQRFQKVKCSPLPAVKWNDADSAHGRKSSIHACRRSNYHSFSSWDSQLSHYLECVTITSSWVEQYLTQHTPICLPYDMWWLNVG
ncbi:hypothetical protein F5877DRAFT_66021 [Lentinula edodes]|nr:hypothetical protein F5877DRAFT_66021 [Lentinula edodes]